MNVASTAEKGSRGRLALAWVYGGTPERVMVLALVTTYVLLLVPLAVEALFYLGHWSPGEVSQTALSFFPAGVAWPAYKTTIYESMFTPDCYRARLTRTDITPAERRYVSEYARFKETIGVRGQFPGGTRRGALYLVTYLAAYLASFPYAALFYPVLGGLTALPFALSAISLAAAAWLVSVHKQRALLQTADAEGFHLTELQRALVESRVRRGGS